MVHSDKCNDNIILEYLNILNIQQFQNSIVSFFFLSQINMLREVINVFDVVRDVNFLNFFMCLSSTFGVVKMLQFSILKFFSGRNVNLIGTLVGQM